MVRDDLSANVAADIYRLLPGKNCGEKSPCGLPKCILFAKEMLRGTKNTYSCPYLEEENRQSIVLILEDFFK